MVSDKRRLFIPVMIFPSREISPNWPSPISHLLPFGSTSKKSEGVG